MRGWLGRAEAQSVRRGRTGSGSWTWWASWARWWRRQGPVDDAAFQGTNEPYPRHWRRPPAPWPPATGGDALQLARDALDELPVTWRQVVTERDIAGRADADVARALDLTDVQQRSILARARAALRDRLDRAHEEGEDR